MGYLSHKAHTCGLHVHVNRDTIEFRIFRGTLKYNKLCDVAVSLPDELLKPPAWTTFVSSIQEPELIQYLKERRLYINEPVQEEDD